MDYDAIIIGAGAGGGPLAGKLAEAGWKVAIIERDAVGGTCVNRGCTPTKTMVACAKIAHMTRRAEQFGVEVDSLKVNVEAVRERKRDIVEEFRSGSEKSLQSKPNLDLVYGEARFIDTHTIAVGDEELSSRSIIIDTGTAPVIPKIAGLRHVPYLDSTSIMELDHVPEHLLVIGAGYIGVEFSQMFRRFGSRVTILVRSNRFLANEDPDVAEAVREVLIQEGIEIRMETELASLAPDSGILATTKGGEKITASHLLIATGRGPVNHTLNLDATDVETDQRGFIKVNAHLETTAPGIWAIGDCNGGPAFTHISYDDHRILRANMLEGRRQSTEGRFVPYTIFSDPQLGRVGLTETQAKEAGHDVLIAKMPMKHVARALETNQSDGLMKVVIDAKTDQILGAAILGMEGGELMAMLQIAMMGNLPYQRLREGTFAHPTLAEGFNNLFQNVHPAVAHV